MILATMQPGMIYPFMVACVICSIFLLFACIRLLTAVMRYGKGLFKHKHSWMYAPGDSPGIISGQNRVSCFHRYCPDCNVSQEIAYYKKLYRANGRFYSGDPVWETVPTTEKGKNVTG
jgi:hypothetical protein